MKAALCLCLVSGLAFGDDVPRMVRVEPGYTATERIWVLNEPGKDKLDAVLARQFDEANRLRAENAQLHSDVLRLASEPTLTWGGALLLVGVGLVLGAAISIPVALKRG